MADIFFFRPKFCLSWLWGQTPHARISRIMLATVWTPAHGTCWTCQRRSLEWHWKIWAPLSRVRYRSKNSRASSSRLHFFFTNTSHDQTEMRWITRPSPLNAFIEHFTALSTRFENVLGTLHASKNRNQCLNNVTKWKSSAASWAPVFLAVILRGLYCVLTRKKSSRGRENTATRPLCRDASWRLYYRAIAPLNILIRGAVHAGAPLLSDSSHCGRRLETKEQFLATRWHLRRNFHRATPPSGRDNKRTKRKKKRTPRCPRVKRQRCSLFGIL